MVPHPDQDRGDRHREGDLRPARHEQGDPMTTTQAVRPWQERFARIAGTVVSLAAAWSVLSVVLRGAGRARGEDLFGWVNLPVGANLFSIPLLVLLAGALHRRLRVAVWILVLFQVLALADDAAQVGLGLTTGAGSLLLHFGPAERVDLLISALAAVVLTPLIVAARGAFPARLYPASRRAAPLVLLGGLTASAVVSLMLTGVFPRTLNSGGERALWALGAVVGVDESRADAAGVLHQGHHWIAAIVGLISGLTLLAAAIVFLRAARA